MTRDVITVDINETLTRVLELMDQHRIHYLPVTELGSLCGIINMLDLVKYRLNEIELEANALKDYVAGRALADGDVGFYVPRSNVGYGSKAANQPASNKGQLGATNRHGAPRQCASNAGTLRGFHLTDKV